jgi:hypothetical protein
VYPLFQEDGPYFFRAATSAPTAGRFVGIAGFGVTFGFGVAFGLAVVLAGALTTGFFATAISTLILRL